METYPWTLFWILIGGGVLATLAVIPYSLAMNPDAIVQLGNQLKAKTPWLPPMLVILLASTVQGGLLVALAVFAGLHATRAIGLGLPILTAAVAGQPVGAQIVAILPAALLAGLVVGILLVALERYYFQPRLPEQFHATTARLSLWKRAMVCFYGGFVEELLLRLFVMSGLVWLMGLVWQSPAGGPALGAFWVANLLATLLFGAGHLPATARIAPLTSLVVTRALVLNGMAGLVFGYLFMTYGLETAILAHFCGDILIHVIAPELPAAAPQAPQTQPA